MTAADRLSARYPQQRVARRLAWLAGLLLGAAGLTWVMWTGLFHANPAVTAQVTQFTVTSDNELVATLTVDRPDPSKAVTCLVFAQAVTYERVGELPLTVMPGDKVLTQVTVNVRTYKRATSVSVESCRTTG